MINLSIHKDYILNIKYKLDLGIDVNQEYVFGINMVITNFSNKGFLVSEYNKGRIHITWEDFNELISET